MIGRALNHVRGNAIAYVALFFAIGGGGGAAIAATVAASSNTIHACVSKKTGAVYVAKKCSRSERSLSFDQRGPRGATGKAGAAGATGPAGTSAVVAWASVGANGNQVGSHGLTVSETSAGVFAVTVTVPQCQQAGIEAPVVTPIGNPTASGPLSGIPVAWAGVTGGSESFTVTSGFIQNDSFVPGNEGFDVQDQCG